MESRESRILAPSLSLLKDLGRILLNMLEETRRKSGMKSNKDLQEISQGSYGKAIEDCWKQLIEVF